MFGPLLSSQVAQPLRLMVTTAKIRFNKRIGFSLPALIWGVFCSPNSHAATISVAVAANVQYAFTALQAAFEKHSEHRLQPSFNASGRLVTQITLGAPFDVFLAADTQYPEALQRAGMAATPPVVYAQGVLVLWSSRALDLSAWQTTLSGNGVKRIAIANPVNAPYGRAADQALTYYGLRSGVESKLVFADSIAQTNQYIHSGAVDVGFTAKSVVSSLAMRGVGIWTEIPAQSYQPILQAMVITKHGMQTHPEASQQFQEFMLSSTARGILAEHGYLKPSLPCKLEQQVPSKVATELCSTPASRMP